MHTNFRSDIAAKWIWKQTQGKNLVFGAPWISDRKLVVGFTFLPALGRWFRFPLFCYVTGKEARKQEARSKLTRYTFMCTATTAEPCTLSLLQSQQEACQWSNWEKGTCQSPDMAFLEPPIQSSFYKRENLRTRMENWLVPSSTTLDWAS